MIELLIKVIAALLNGVSRYRSFVYKSANGASWEVLFRFENDPSDERYGGGLALLSARFALNTDTMQLSNISPVSYVQFTTSRTTYFTRNAAVPDSVSVESPPLLDGMGKPFGGTGGGVRLLPRPWLVSNGANPKAFAMGDKEQAAIEASMKSDPTTRPVAKDVVAIHVLVPQDSTSNFPIGTVQFDVRARFQAANYQFVSGFRFFDNGVIEPYVSATGATLPSPDGPTLPVDSRAKVHLHDFYLWYLLDSSSMVGPHMRAQTIRLDHEGALPYFVHSEVGTFKPLGENPWPIVEDEAITGHLVGLRLLKNLDLDLLLKEGEELPGTWAWLEQEKWGVIIDWQHDDMSDVKDYLGEWSTYTDQGWRALLRAVKFDGDAARFIAKVANTTHAIQVSPSDQTATGAKSLASGMDVLGCLRLYHLHLPTKPDANLTPLRSVWFAIRPRVWPPTAYFDAVYKDVNKQ